MPETPSPSIEDRIKQMMPQMTEQVAQQIRQRALDQLEHHVAHIITEEVKKYVVEAIVPTLQRDLASRHDEIKACFLAAITDAFGQVAVKVSESAAKKLASYDGDKLIAKVMQEIFGRGY